MEKMSHSFFSFENTFIIAEIGQNHQGDLNVAKKLIDTAKIAGADCVKFQKTCLAEKYNKAALKKPYLGKNSWGKTYGEHKTFLEFTEKEFEELQTYAKENNILFTASAMDCISLKYLANLNAPFIKIGSGDCNNFVLIEQAAKMNMPLIVSTGMQSFETVKNVYNLISKYHKNFALLHCVSAYPTPVDHLNLRVIERYRTEFPDIAIGYSGHETEFFTSVAAVALGAKIIERHITLDKTLKGSDHICSLDPTEFTTMVAQIRNLEIAMGNPIKALQQSEIACYNKLGKSIVVTKALKKGHIINKSDLAIKVAEPKGIDGRFLEEIVGKILKTDLESDDSLQREFLDD